MSAPVNFSTTPNTDGIDGWGPLAFGTVENIFGTNGDDFVALLCYDPGLARDVSGSITDITVRNLFPGQGASPNGGSACTLYSGSTFPLKRIHVEDIHGSSRTYAVSITSATSANPVDDIFISRVDNTATNSAVGIKATGGGSITLRDITWAGNSGTGSGDSMIYVDPASVIGATMQVTAASAIMLNVNGGSITTLIINNVNQPTTLSNVMCSVASGSAVKVLSVSGMHVFSTASHAFYIAGNVGKFHISDVYLTGSGTELFATATTASAMQVLLNNVTLDGANYLSDAESIIDFIITGLNVQSITQTTLIWLGNTGSTVTVRGAGLVNPTNVSLFGHLSTPTIPARASMAEARSDVSALNRGFSGDIEAYAKPQLLLVRGSFPEMFSKLTARRIW